MVDVTDALLALEITDFVLRGEPTNQTEFNQMFRKITGADSSGTSIESDDPADFGVTWSQVSAKITELQNAEPMKLLRVERNDKLAETDWWASSDLTITDEQKKYRQDLRDITKSATSLDDVKWPTKPE
tara:strand:+ start:101 stop:487 length:387 start_codon:yes stop_codon:yes gene_type:complete